MRIENIMTRDPEVVPSDSSLQDAALKMQELLDALTERLKPP